MLRRFTTDSDFRNRILTILGIYLGFIFLFFSEVADPLHPGLVPSAAVILATSVLLFGVVVELRSASAARRYVVPVDDKDAISKYLLRFADRPGRLSIYSRDMSWVTNDHARMVLLEKAHSDNLQIFVPKRTPKLDSTLLPLEAAGAHVYT
jgi:hypothetical protein